MYVCVYLCMYVCICVCTHVATYVCTHVFMYVCTHVSMCVGMYVCLFVCIYMYACVCVYFCMYMCMYVCTYSYEYTHIRASYTATRNIRTHHTIDVQARCIQILYVPTPPRLWRRVSGTACWSWRRSRYELKGGAPCPSLHYYRRVSVFVAFISSLVPSILRALSLFGKLTLVLCLSLFPSLSSFLRF
jgi:hypothetical protein